MSNLSTIIAKGILASDTIVSKLAEMIEANNNVAKFLAGDMEAPTIEQAKEYVKKEINSKCTFNKVEKIYLDSDFNYRIVYSYSFTNYVKNLGDSSWNSKSAPDEEHSIPKTFIDRNDMIYSL